jgi:hypothetical protein
LFVEKYNTFAKASILTERLKRLKMVAYIQLDKEVTEGEELKKLLGQ